MHNYAQNRGRTRDMGKRKMKHTIKFNNESDRLEYIKENFPNSKVDSRFHLCKSFTRFICGDISLIAYFDKFLVIYL